MKILLLLPDGVGVRNFIYTDFIELALSRGNDVDIWADEVILNLIDKEGIEKHCLPNEKSTTPLIEIRRKAWSKGLLKWQTKYFNNHVYLRYIFHNKITSVKSLARATIEVIILLTHKDRKKLNKIRDKYLEDCKKIPYYKKCLDQLKIIRPDIVFCTHQRSSRAIAPLLAAQSIGIRTACFIYSWDNLPKANLYIKVDNYFVWSHHMKEEILMYYPELNSANIFITGSSQFIPYFDNSKKISRSEFAKRYNLSYEKKWICFSGDDVTTSPHDQYYLKDLGEAVQRWNLIYNEKLHIVFRRCPTDFSSRYDDVIREYNDIITEVRPAWRTLHNNEGWDKIVPEKIDSSLLINTVLHCEFVVNVGSTMAHDFCLYNKPCIYIKYNIDHKKNLWNAIGIYENIHFQTMHNLEPVIWIENKSLWIDKIQYALYRYEGVVADCKKWHERVVLYPLEEANERIIKTLENLVK